MEISKTAVGVLAGLCILAGAGGAFFATRGDAQVDATVVTEAPLVSPDPSATAVDESEAIVADDTATPVAPAPAAPARPARTAPARTVAPPERENRVAAARTSVAPPFEPARRRLQTANLEPRVATPPALDPVQPREREPARSLCARLNRRSRNSRTDCLGRLGGGLQFETSISSERARVEDEVLARVTRDVAWAIRVAIPADRRRMARSSWSSAADG